MDRDEFFALTLRQIDALMKRHRREAEHQEFMLAQLTSCLVNFSHRAPKQPSKTTDFMPSQWAKRKADRTPRRLTVAKRKAIVNAFRMFFPPQVKK